MSINVTEVMAAFSEQKPQFLKDNAKSFMELMNYYECALMEIETKLKVLNAEFSLEYERNPFESIKCRLKKPASIVEKLYRKGYDISLEGIEENMFDIAGIRVICSFPEDIYTTAELLCRQDDIRVISRKDYIKEPKENGYRSLHLILEIPIFLSSGKRYMKVEVQFRTIAMDFWASLEHKLKYKKDIRDPEYIARELKECADIITNMDLKMQKIRNLIDEQNMDEKEGLETEE